MKKMLNKYMMVVAATILMSVFAINTSKAQGRISLQVFYNELAPYGTWMDCQDYGYVWIPRVSAGFTPYGTNGYWVNTQYGNTWVSDYNWGWAPFHYGRWFYDDFYGWVWVPDTEWAPAWVAWRNGGGYYGWAPLMPGFGFSASYAYYNGIPDYYWNFCQTRYIMYRNVNTYYVPRPRVVNIIHNTTIITNNYRDRGTRYFTGPSRREMERVNRDRVEVHRINSQSAPGRTEVDSRMVKLYRPEVDNSRESRRSAAPVQVARDVRSNNNRKAAEAKRQVEPRRESTPQPIDVRRDNDQRDVERRREVAPTAERQREDVNRENIKREQPAEVQRTNRSEVEKINREEQVREQRNDAAQMRKLNEQRENEAREAQRRTIEQNRREQEVQRTVREQNAQRQRENARQEQQQPRLSQPEQRTPVRQQSPNVERRSNNNEQPRRMQPTQRPAQQRRPRN